MAESPLNGLYPELGRAVTDGDRIVVTSRPFGPAGVSSVELADTCLWVVDHFELDRFVRLEVPAEGADSSPVLHAAFGPEGTLELLDHLDEPPLGKPHSVRVDDYYGRVVHQGAYRFGRLVVLADLAADVANSPLRRLAAAVELDARLPDAPAGELVAPLLPGLLAMVDEVAAEIDLSRLPELDARRDEGPVRAFGRFARRRRHEAPAAAAVAAAIEDDARRRAERPRAAHPPAGGTRIGVPLEWRSTPRVVADALPAPEHVHVHEVRRAEPSLVEVVVNHESDPRWAVLHQRGRSATLALAPLLAEGELDRAELLVPVDLADDDVVVEIVAAGDLAARHRTVADTVRLAIRAGRDAAAAERSSQAQGSQPMPSRLAEAQWVVCHRLWRDAGDEHRGDPSSRQLFSGSFGRRLRGSPLLPDLFDRDDRYTG